MKKSISKILYLVLVLSVVLSSCKKSDDDEDNGKIKNAFLIGGTYVSYDKQEVLYGIETGRELYDVFKFMSDTEFEYTYRRNSGYGEILSGPYKGTYTVDYPNISLGVLAEGTFKNDSVFVVKEEDGRTREFKRQAFRYD